MDIEQIRDLLHVLSERLEKKGLKGEITIYGGTVMALVYKARLATKDIDAVFEPVEVIYQIADDMSITCGLPRGWLNDAVRRYTSENKDVLVYADLPGLRILIPSEKYMLAMKCLAARDSDFDDIVFLIKRLGLKSSDQLFDIIEEYYDFSKIPYKTKVIAEAYFKDVRSDDAN
ncbi:MAG: hypothetical protein K6T29_05955 [Peptococcaceae bacterium]|nr:hypothetical protein [Peptococcaceae bacterium]